MTWVKNQEFAMMPLSSWANFKLFIFFKKSKEYVLDILVSYLQSDSVSN